MMKKNEIYVEMLGRALTYIRNVQSQDSIRKAKDISCYYEAELVHNLLITIFDAEFEQHDIWFLNHQARYYYENCNTEISINYDKQVSFIKELFAMVPVELKNKLTWNGPI